MIKGIVFDKDGTVLNYEAMWVPIAEYAVKRLLGVSDPSLNQKVLQAIGAYDGISGILCSGTYGDITEVINGVLKQEKAMLPPIEPAMTAESFFCGMSYGKLEPACQNITGVFSQLKAQGLHIGMVTSDNQEVTSHCLKGLGIASYFDVVYTDDGVHPSKPDPYYLARFCETFDLKPEEVVMVGDTLTDCRFAENAGTHFVGVAKTEQDRQILLTRAAYVVEDISGILAAVEMM